MNIDGLIRSFLAWALLLLILPGSGASEVGTEWPQYRGANRDGVSREKIVSTWPEGGPKVLWKVPVGDGYSGMAVSADRVYTMDATKEDEFAICLETSTGKEVWRTRIDSNFVNDQGNGPRATPTLDGDMVYVFGAQGTLSALNAGDGSKVWSHDVKKELQGKIPIWGYSSSPLIEGELLILPVGGGEGNAVVAFHKKSGAVAWKSETDEPGYSSPVAITANGARQIIVFSGTVLLSLSPANGKLIWRYPWKTDWFVNAATPIFIPNDKIFISTSYDRGAALLKLNATGGRPTVEELWLSKEMKNHFNSSVYHNGHLYGFDNTVLKCIDANSGEEKWKKPGLGRGSLILVDGHLIVLSERGQLLLVEAIPAEFKQKAGAQVLQGKCWTMPTVAGGKLYLRNQKEMICLDLNGKA